MLKSLRDFCAIMLLLFGIMIVPEVVAFPTVRSIPAQQVVFEQLPGQTLLAQKPTRGVTRGTPPPAALCLPFKTITAVHDGDTGTVLIQLKLNVRYDNCWAPELKERLGKESATRAKEAIGKGGRLFISLSDVHNLADLLTFGRVVGEIWLDGEVESESQKQIRLKLASTTKGGTLGE